MSSFQATNEMADSDDEPPLLSAKAKVGAFALPARFSLLSEIEDSTDCAESHGEESSDDTPRKSREEEKPSQHLAVQKAFHSSQSDHEEEEDDDENDGDDEESSGSSDSSGPNTPDLSANSSPSLTYLPAILSPSSSSSSASSSSVVYNPSLPASSLPQAGVSVSYVSPKVEARVCETGSGIFALEPIEKDEVLLVWTGRIRTAEETLQKVMPTEDRHYILQVGDGFYQTPLQPSREPADWTNHSCAPNAGFGRHSPITLSAMKRLEKGEEICFDYAMCETDERLWEPMKCECKAPCCRGEITANDWRRPELWEKYRGYWSPHVWQRIKQLRKEMEQAKQKAPAQGKQDKQGKLPLTNEDLSFKPAPLNCSEKPMSSTVDAAHNTTGSQKTDLLDRYASLFIVSLVDSLLSRVGLIRMSKAN